MPTSAISFPILRRLDVDSYGLFPGTQSKPGLHVEFKPGLTLILGANGLGKTTLVTLIYRLCTGPYELPRATGRELGGRRRSAVELGRADRRLFADRVNDGARDATATLAMELGDVVLEITRRLDNLGLQTLKIDGADVEASEATYHDYVLEQAALPSFGDWILLLRHLTFYFEDRRALVWDATAQRQVLRLLFLPTKSAEKWARLEREVLELDSAVRNDQYALTRAERAAAQTEHALEANVDLKTELKLLDRKQKRASARLAALDEKVVHAEATRQRARLAALRAEADHESAQRDLERRQLRLIDAAFPSEDQTMRYLLTKIAAGETCLVCGTHNPAAIESVNRRLKSGDCVVCGSSLQPRGVTTFSSRSIAQAERAVERTAVSVEASCIERDDAEEEHDTLLRRLQELNTELAVNAARIDDILKRLPPRDSDVQRQRSDLVDSRTRLELSRQELEKKRSSYARFIARMTAQIREQRSAVQDSFQAFAKGFLLEQTRLLWEPKKDRVGETGKLIDFPAYQLDMTGSDFQSPVRRAGPEEVSESQREFIDLAFRMALMEVAGRGAGASLVIDAPESSLDAVFVTRAARVLARFAKRPATNRLVVTSNLIEGDLIPALARQMEISSSRDSRLVDLLRVAAPTAAVRELSTDYRQVRTSLFKRLKQQ